MPTSRSTSCRLDSAGTPFSSVSVSSMPVRAFPPMARPTAVIGRLALATPMTCQLVPSGSSRTRYDEQSRVAPHAAADAHDEGHLQRLDQQALVHQVEHHVQVSGVVDLDLGLDAELDHPRRQLHHLLGRIAELGGAERHRARVERGHRRLGFDEGHALLVGELEPAGGELDDARTHLADGLDRAPCHVEVGRHVALIVAEVDVDDGRAGFVAGLGVGGDLRHGSRASRRCPPWSPRAR